MFQSRSEYDRGVNTFSPEGRLFQVEYAIEAIKIGTTAIGISTSEGIVLAVEKRLLSPLQEASSVEKLAEIDSHIGCAMSGLSADARTLIDHARSESQYHRFTFNEPMKVDSLTQAVCDLALRFGESGEENTMSRPFGVALLVAGWDKHGPALYHTDPSGTFTRFDAKAIGAGSEGAQTSLQEQFHKNLTLEEAETMAVTILKQVPALAAPRARALPRCAPRAPARRPAPRGRRPPRPRPAGDGGEARHHERRGRRRQDASRQGGAARHRRVPLRPRRPAPPAVLGLHQGAARDDHRPPRRPRVVGGAPGERASE